MASTTPDGTLARWYRQRIGEPNTTDEASGYWLFAAGVVLGIVGVLVFLTTSPATATRQWSIVVAAAGFALLVAGPVIRLPLRRSATWLVYLGLVICAAAIVWFVVAFPVQWSPQSGQPTIIALYTAGLLSMAVGGVLVPVLSGGRDLEAELDDARAAMADTAADEADLAAQLRALRTSQARFELYADKSDEWRWRLRHRNGNVIADSGESYTAIHNAQNGLESVRRNALGATIMLIESEAELPAAEEAFEPVAVAESQGRFETYEDAAGENRWRLVHENGNVLADSGEGYTRRHGAGRGLAALRERADELEFEVYEDRRGEHRWRASSANDEIVADSGEGYADGSEAEAAAERVRELAPAADVLDVGRAAFEVYEAADGEWRWRLRHRNGNVLADSGEGYADRSGCWDAIESVKRHGPNAEVTA